MIVVGTRSKPEVVQASDIIEALQEGKEIRLRYARIEGSIEFHREIKQDVYFIQTEFSGGVGFRDAEFSGKVYFTFAKFSGKSRFLNALFAREVNFFYSTIEAFDLRGCVYEKIYIDRWD